MYKKKLTTEEIVVELMKNTADAYEKAGCLFMEALEEVKDKQLALSLAKRFEAINRAAIYENQILLQELEKPEGESGMVYN